MNKTILVFYIYVGGQSRERAIRNVGMFKDKISNMDEDDENIIKYFIPTRDRVTEVVCLNPVLMTNEQYAETKLLLDSTKEKIENFLKEELDSIKANPDEFLKETND